MSDTTSTSPPRKAHAEAHNTWISTFFANNTVSVKTKGKVERWIIGAQIGSEKEHRDEKDTDWPYDASAVVECTSRESNGESTHAIAKIYMQYVRERIHC
ncbi:hypothetical protein PMZ80_008191 [Knufia obscura]|uniref:Uncharacterized protein n=1 Tax=Knufia obscura TaxID=1635080 RepID=A0ABR0RGQ2_9EURO|nr:hypothetical protein PMZ80_008191 [Knufia obscura]